MNVTIGAGAKTHTVNVSSGRAAATPAADAVLALDDRGTICSCNSAAEALFSYRSDELVGRHVSSVLPDLRQMQLTCEGRPNPRLRFLSSVGHHFEVAAGNGGCFPSELFLTCLDDSGPARLRLTVRPLARA